MSLEMHRIDNTYMALDDENHIVLTPAGNKIRTRFPGLLQETLDDLEDYGPDPEAAISMYSLVCSYIDFAREASKQALIELVINDLPHDIVFGLPPSPEAHHLLNRCYRNKLFNRLGVIPSLSVPLNLDRVKNLLNSELKGLSKRELTVVICFSTSLGSSLLGLAVVTHSIDLGYLAQAYCMRLHSYLLVQSDLVCTGEVGQYDYEPDIINEQYCDDVCCMGSEYDHPVRLTSSCSVVQMFETLQRFCGFPDE